jgi:predicted MFS family arabinose efflux permease
MTTRWLAVLIAIVGLAMLALFLLWKCVPGELPTRAEGKRAVRRFGRRKGEPLPLLSRQRQQPAASG